MTRSARYAAMAGWPSDVEPTVSFCLEIASSRSVKSPRRSNRSNRSRRVRPRWVRYAAWSCGPVKRAKLSLAHEQVKQVGPATLTLWLGCHLSLPRRLCDLSSTYCPETRMFWKTSRSVNEGNPVVVNCGCQRLGRTKPSGANKRLSLVGSGTAFDTAHDRFKPSKRVDLVFLTLPLTRQVQLPLG